MEEVRENTLYEEKTLAMAEFLGVKAVSESLTTEEVSQKEEKTDDVNPS